MDQPHPGSPESNPYDFILNPPKPSRSKGLKDLGGNRFIITIVSLVGGVLLLMIVTTLLLNALAPKKISKQELIGLTQTQQELIRISNEGAADATRQTIRNLAITAQYSLITQQKQTLSLLAKNGVKVGTKELALKQNAQTDQKFANAKATSTFDTTFVDIINRQLTGYANTLKTLSAQARTQKERDLVSDYYQQTQQLISQVPYTQDDSVMAQ